MHTKRIAFALVGSRSCGTKKPKTTPLAHPDESGKGADLGVLGKVYFHDGERVEFQARQQAAESQDD
jgi:hypothetical protein